MNIRKGPKPASDAPLRGVPPPRGTHTRFDEEGQGQDSPQRTKLRGVPAARGARKTFDE
jgi:hypothetical protein